MYLGKIVTLLLDIFQLLQRQQRDHHSLQQQQQYEKRKKDTWSNINRLLITTIQVTDM